VFARVVRRRVTLSRVVVAGYQYQYQYQFMLGMRASM